MEKAIVEIIKERQGVQKDTLFNLVIAKVGSTTNPMNGDKYVQVFEDLIGNQTIVKKEIVYEDPTIKGEGYFLQQ
jgi:hypothetical protein